jgi:3-oxoacyl-[acyl-carrier protein] reductase
MRTRFHLLPGRRKPDDAHMTERRTAIVCGSSSGIGRAIARRLRDDGLDVVLFARRRELLAEEADEPGTLVVPGDLRIEDDRARLVEATLERFGRIDVLVNNGGGPPAGRAADITSEAAREAFELVVVAPLHLTSLCLPHLKAAGAGRVINVQSTSAFEPIPELALSNLVRPGILGWAKTLANEVAESGVTVNTIAPGRTDTERLRSIYGDDPPTGTIPLKRLARPAEIAAAASFLASLDASYVTGSVLVVDGGISSTAH